jgi:hypothetical protein
LGKLIVLPEGQPWKWDHMVGGGPVYSGKGSGYLFTAYTNWDALWRNTTSVAFVGVGLKASYLMVTFLRADALPMAQIHVAMDGAGLVGGGGPGKWERK